MLRILGSDLRLVLVEAQAHSCRVVFVKDKGGVYMMSEKGGTDANGRRTVVAYAVGCNPDIDEFDDWWERSRQELGGDAVNVYCSADDPVFGRVLKGTHDLIIRAATGTLHLKAAKSTKRKP